MRWAPGAPAASPWAPCLPHSPHRRTVRVCIKVREKRAVARWRFTASVRPSARGRCPQANKNRQKAKTPPTHTLDQATSAADVSPALRMNAGPAGQGPPLRKTQTKDTALAYSLCRQPLPSGAAAYQNCKRDTPIDAARVSRRAAGVTSRESLPSVSRVTMSCLCLCGIRTCRMQGPWTWPEEARQAASCRWRRQTAGTRPSLPSRPRAASSQL